MQKTAAVESPVSANDATAVAALAMDKEEMMQWLRTILNREPETNDLYAVAKQFYHIGAFDKTRLALVQFLAISDSASAATLPAQHLLAYAHTMLNERPDAIKSFKRCVRHGFEDDWQMLVELQLEMTDG